MTNLLDIKNFDLSQLQKFLLEHHQPKFHAQQIFSWIYQRSVYDFNKMTNLPQNLRELLKKYFFINSLLLGKKQVSLDGTQKLLFKLSDGNFIESVIIPGPGRNTGCISSQVGCKFSCKFCASGALGFRRDLTAGEIINEILFLRDHCNQKKLTHLVFMGTGEPFDNYDNVLKAIRIINSKESLNIGARRITISTSGVIPGIDRLIKEDLQIELSVSLHAASDQLRSEIMPVNKAYPLKYLLNTCRKYISQTNRQITFEYTLINGMNSDLKNAQELVKLLRGMNCKINLIPVNPIKEMNIMPPLKKNITEFKEYLARAGINVTLRAERGQDINAACGQLRLKYEKK